jgi:hypothetical protein
VFHRFEKGYVCFEIYTKREGRIKGAVLEVIEERMGVVFEKNTKIFSNTKCIKSFIYRKKSRSFLYNIFNSAFTILSLSYETEEGREDKGGGEGIKLLAKGIKQKEGNKHEEV